MNKYIKETHLLAIIILNCYQNTFQDTRTQIISFYETDIPRIWWFLWYPNAWMAPQSSEIPCKGWHMHSADTMNRTIRCNYPSVWKTLCNCQNIKILIAPCENTQSSLTNAIEKCANFALSSELRFTQRRAASSSRPFSNLMLGIFTAE